MTPFGAISRSRQKWHTHNYKLQAISKVSIWLVQNPSFPLECLPTSYASAVMNTKSSVSSLVDITYDCRPFSSVFCGTSPSPPGPSDDIFTDTSDLHDCYTAALNHDATSLRNESHENRRPALSINEIKKIEALVTSPETFRPNRRTLYRTFPTDTKETPTPDSCETCRTP